MYSLTTIKCLSMRVLVLLLLANLWASTVHASQDYEQQHPYYQLLLDSLNTSEDLLFRKHHYVREGSSATAITHVYQVSPDDTDTVHQLLTLEHAISYPVEKMQGISSSNSVNTSSVEILTTIDFSSLPESLRLAVNAAFGSELPVQLRSNFQEKTIEHHIKVPGWFIENDNNTLSSEGFDAGIVGQASGALAAYAGLNKMTFTSSDNMSMQLDQLLFALNVLPLYNSSIPLFDFTAKIPGAVSVSIPIDGFPITGSVRDIEYKTGFHHREGTYSIDYSFVANDIVVPVIPLKSTKFEMSFNGIQGQALSGFEKLIATSYADEVLSEEEQSAWIQWVRNNLLAPGLGMNLEGSVDSIMGDANLHFHVEIDDKNNTEPSTWNTYRDVLQDITAKFTIDADRTLYSLIPESELPDQDILDRVITIDGNRVTTSVRLEDGVMWINDEPMSLALILGSEIDKPLWPNDAIQKSYNEHDSSKHFLGNQPEISSLARDGSEHNPNPDQNNAYTQTDALNENEALAQLKIQTEALQAEIALLQMEIQTQKSTRDQLQAQALSEQDKPTFKAENSSTHEQLTALSSENAENNRNARIQQRQFTKLRTRYFTAIRQSVERNWRKPSDIEGPVDCTVSIIQNTSGEILKVNTVDCINSTAKLRNSVKRAVIASSPLPQAPDKSLFDRRVKFYFRPG